MLLSLTDAQNQRIIEVQQETWRNLDQEARDREYLWAREASEKIAYPISTYLAVQAWVSLANVSEQVLTSSGFHLLTAFTLRDYLAELFQIPAYSNSSLGYLVRQTDNRYLENSVQLSHALFGARKRPDDIERPWYWRVPKKIDRDVLDELLNFARVDDADVDTLTRLVVDP